MGLVLSMVQCKPLRDESLFLQAKIQVFVFWEMFGTDESEVFPLFEILRPRALGAAGVLACRAAAGFDRMNNSRT